MAHNLKETFNELTALRTVYEAWGKAAIPLLPPEAIEALTVAMTENEGENFIYTALDQSAYEKIKSAAPEDIDLKKACDILARFIKQADFNMNILLPFMTTETAKEILPNECNTNQVRSLAERHGLKALPGLLPNT